MVKINDGSDIQVTGSVSCISEGIVLPAIFTARLSESVDDGFWNLKQSTGVPAGKDDFDDLEFFRHRA